VVGHAVAVRPATGQAGLINKLRETFGPPAQEHCHYRAHLLPFRRAPGPPGLPRITAAMAPPYTVDLVVTNASVLTNA
jgi:hypothetical protein